MKKRRFRTAAQSLEPCSFPASFRRPCRLSFADILILSIAERCLMGPGTGCFDQSRSEVSKD